MRWFSHPSGSRPDMAQWPDGPVRINQTQNKMNKQVEQTTKNKSMKLQDLIRTAEQNNFQDYLDCPHPDRIEYPNVNSFMMTCAEGLYSGEVIDALYDYKTGEVISLSVYSQFKGVKAKFTF